MDDIKKICFDYFSGAVDSKTAAAISAFLKADEGNAAQFKAWEDEWSRNNIPTYSQIKAYNTIEHRLRRNSRRRVASWVGSTVAFAAICLALVFRTSLVNVLKESQHLIVETAYCEHTKVTLPDSTQVWLNAASKISYEKNLFSGERVVNLDGEAYFDVTHKEGSPFIVNLGKNSIKVLGTKFNVSSYSHESICEASLIEGSIEFTTPGTTIQMKPGEMLTYNNDNGTLVKTQCDVSKGLSWMDNRLDYDTITLKQLLARLSSIYGVDITFYPRRLAKHTFAVNLSLEETMPNILDGLSIILPIAWKYGDNGEFVVVETIN